MSYKIENELLKVEIASLGAEVQSIKKNDKQYLWQGSPDSWTAKATNLFPFIGRSTNGKYIYKENEYEMTPHGFVRYENFEVFQNSSTKITFKTCSTKKTLEIYPFDFEYEICYELIKNSLKINHKVLNKGNNTMYFGLGGHPGFNLPLNENLKFEDYYIEFSEQCNAQKYEIIEFNIGKAKDYPLKNGKVLNLKHELFDNDALIFKNVPKSLTIKSDKSDEKIIVNYPDMKFLAIWHSPKKQVPFICIEPWTSLPARHSIIEDIEQLEDFIKLKHNEIYTNSWEIIF